MGQRQDRSLTDKTRRADISAALLEELDRLRRHRREEYLAKGIPEIPE